MNGSTAPIRMAGLILALAAGAAPARAAIDNPAANLPAFYANLGSVAADARLGQVIRQEQIATPIPEARAWRIAYVSSDVADRKTLTTAIVVAPTRPAGPGGRPIVAWAHGTTGTAQGCGPSQLANPAQTFNLYFSLQGDAHIDYGIPALERFIRNGWVVVSTDFQGLGGGGKHQYMVTGTQAHDLIDSARAVAAMPEVGAGRRAALYGWSQGAGAVLTAAGQRDYLARTGTAADGLDIVGAVALAPPDVSAPLEAAPKDPAVADRYFKGLVTAFSKDTLNFSHLAMGLWAIAGTYADVKLDDVFTPEGATAVEQMMATKCGHPVVDALNHHFEGRTKELLRPDLQNVGPWAVHIFESGTPRTAPVAPVAIYWGTKDTAVPPIMGQVYQKRMCGRGANVSRTRLPGEQTHHSTPAVAEPLYTAWLEARFAGTPAVDGCKEAP